jgi:dipeptidyl aminopeptidase/acylaminoacyl peptidase
VQVTSGGQTSVEFDVAYTEPSTIPLITGTTPDHLLEGILTTVEGQNFGTSGELRLNDELVETSMWTDTLIAFTVPPGIGVSTVDITVTSGGQTSAPFRLTYTAAIERQLTFDSMGCFNPCWSADGTTIYFEAQAPDGTTAFYRVPFEGGATSLLYNGPGNDRMLDVQYYQAGALIWISDRTDGGNTDGDWEVREAAAGFNPQGFLETFPGSNTETERYPVWSHTERFNVDCAWSQDGLGGHSMIYVRRLATLEPLVSGFSPCFNPNDGEFLAYMRSGSGTGLEILTISLAPDSSPELLYSDSSVAVSHLAWGKGGDIAYKKGLHIWIMDEDGTNHRKLTTSTGQEAYPKFSPNGAWVAFSRLVNTGFEIFVAQVPN